MHHIHEGFVECKVFAKILVHSQSPCRGATGDVLESVLAQVILDVDFMQIYLFGKNAFGISQMGFPAYQML
uniref:Uncharacterized protein n=1 Tax=Parascaris equorum TaxID=6256 RepID=A0A914RRM4_PAREQ